MTKIRNIKRNKFEIFIREILLIWAFFFLFPIKSIRALAWRWEIWLKKVDKEIDKGHEDYFNI